MTTSMPTSIALTLFQYTFGVSLAEPTIVRKDRQPFVLLADTPEKVEALRALVYLLDDFQRSHYSRGIGWDHETGTREAKGFAVETIHQAIGLYKGFDDIPHPTFLNGLYALMDNTEGWWDGEVIDLVFQYRYW